MFVFVFVVVFSGGGGVFYEQRRKLFNRRVLLTRTVLEPYSKIMTKFGENFREALESQDNVCNNAIYWGHLVMMKGTLRDRSEITSGEGWMIRGGGVTRISYSQEGAPRFCLSSKGGTQFSSNINYKGT